MGGRTLDEGDELEVTRADLFEEAVDFLRVAGVEGVDDGEDVEIDAVALENVEAAQDAREGGLAGAVLPVGVVEAGGAVDAEADEEPVLGQEAAPRVIQEGAVGLKGVVDAFAAGVPLLKSDDLAEKLDAHKGGLAALPRERDLLDILRGDVLANVALEHRGRHAAGTVGGKAVLLFEVEAVAAIEVARGAGGLRHHVKRRPREGRPVDGRRAGGSRGGTLGDRHPGGGESGSGAHGFTLAPASGAGIDPRQFPGSARRRRLAQGRARSRADVMEAARPREIQRLAVGAALSMR